MKIVNFKKIALSTFVALTAATAFASGTDMPKEAVTLAKAVLTPTQGNSVAGTVTFIQFADGIKIVGDMTGLTPGEHGFHIHEFGDCSAPDAMSAGSHFNPTHMPHGAHDAPQHHAGDFGNIIADASGKAHFELVDNTISFTGPNSILGRGLIVHKDKDDLQSQPAGNAGARVACGIIGVTKP